MLAIYVLNYFNKIINCLTNSKCITLKSKKYVLNTFLLTFGIEYLSTGIQNVLLIVILCYRAVCLHVFLAVDVVDGHGVVPLATPQLWQVSSSVGWAQRVEFVRASIIYINYFMLAIP